MPGDKPTQLIVTLGSGGVRCREEAPFGSLWAMMPANCAFRRLLVKCVASTLCRSAAAANLRAPPPPQLNSTADLQQLCTEQLGLCVVGALNPGVAVHSRHLDNLGAIAMKEAGKVGFLHREGVVLLWAVA